MSAAPFGAPRQDATRRTLRWLLGAQLFIAAALIVVDLAPMVPELAQPSAAPAFDRPTRPGDQTRRYREDDPALTGPGVAGDVPRRLMVESARVDGAPVTLLRGAIEPGDAARVVAALERERPARIALDSPGGSVLDALEIGRTVRALGADTVMRDGAVCLSACPYIFVGGTGRAMARDARLGVHQHSFGESSILPAFLAVEDVQRGQAEVLDHLAAMGVDLRIMGPAMATPSDEIYILTPDELREWGVVTE